MAALVSGDTPEWFHVPNARIARRPQTHSPRSAGTELATRSALAEPAPRPEEGLRSGRGRRSFTMTNPIVGLVKRSRAPTTDDPMSKSIDAVFLDKRRYRDPASFERRHEATLRSDGAAFHMRKGPVGSFMAQANVNRYFLASLPSRSRGEVDPPPPSFGLDDTESRALAVPSMFGQPPPLPRKRRERSLARPSRRAAPRAEDGRATSEAIRRFEVTQHASINLAEYTKRELRELLLEHGVRPPDAVSVDPATGDEVVALGRKREYLAACVQLLRANAPEPVFTRGCKLRGRFFILSLFPGALRGVRVTAYSSETSTEYKLGLTASQLRDSHLLPPPADRSEWGAWSPPLFQRLAVVDGRLDLVDAPVRGNGLPAAFSLQDEEAVRDAAADPRSRPASRQGIAAYFTF